MPSSRTPRLVPWLAGLGVAVVVAACGSAVATPEPTTVPVASAETSGPGPACTSPAAPTTPQLEGPYYSAGAPESADLVTDGMEGTRLTLTGWVVDTTCAPLANAKVETWQADAAGVYDNTGYALRGWVTTDADGRFAIRTVVPGEYPGRTEHIHVKVTPDGGATLTSQLYFPGTTANDGDGIFDPSLLLDIAEDGDALTGTYTFVIAR